MYYLLKTVKYRTHLIKYILRLSNDNIISKLVLIGWW